MRKRFAANLFILLTANLLVKPYWIFGIDRVVQNKVGPEVYGTYFAVFNFSFLLSIILDFGINNFNNRAVSRSNQRVGDYLMNLMVLKLLLSFIYFALTFSFALLSGFGAVQMKMLLLLAVNQVLLSALLYFRSNIAALQMFRIDSLLSVLDRLLTIVFCLALLYAPAWADGFDIMWFIYAQTLALFISAAVAFLIIAGKTTMQFNFWKPGFARMILLKSAPFAMLGLLMGIYYRVDAVMIERMLPNGAHEAGVYAASFRLLDALNMFGYLFATLLLPMFASMIRKKESTRALVKFSAELMLAGSVMAAVICYFFRVEVMSLLYRDSTDYWARIFGWLMLNFIPMSSIYIFGTLLTAKGSLKVLNSIAVGGLVINIGLNLFLIPRLGALGATYATLATQFFAAGAHVYFANKEFRFEYEVKELVKVAAFVLLSIGISYVAHQLPVLWYYGFAVAIAGCGCAAAVFGLLPVKNVVQMVLSKKTTE